MQSSGFVEPLAGFMEQRFGFPWRRTQHFCKADMEELENSTAILEATHRQVSTTSTASTSATSTGSFQSHQSSASSADITSTPSDPEDSHDEEADSKTPEKLRKMQPFGAGPPGCWESPKACHYGSPDRANHTLRASTNSWAAGLQSRRNRTKQGEEGQEDIVRKMKAILNKLTIEKFPKLSTQLASCGIRSTSHLEELIREILEKATTQHHFINMYADLCSVLQAHFANPCVSSDPNMNFKKILLNACQASFEKRLTAPTASTALNGEQLELAQQQYKLQMLGNIKFVGALLVRKMLAGKVMFAIIEELLSDSSSEALESLAALLTVVGPTFDQPECPHQPMLVNIFHQVEARTKDTRVKHRVRCLLQDVLELRASGWQDRKPKKLEGPSTLEEVAQKFHAESEAPSPSKRSQGSPNSASLKPVLAAMLASDRYQLPASKSDSAKVEQSQTSVAKTDCVTRQASDRVQSSSPKAEQSLPQCSNDTNDEEGQLLKFIEANGIDEEGAEDLKACSREVQEMVLAKGSVTAARNPSAMLRVRINQSLRELKKKSKSKAQVVERARPARPTSDSAQATSQKKESAKCNEQPKMWKEKASEDKPAELPFDKEVCRKELVGTYSELVVSHDVQEAVTRVAAMPVPDAAQAEELCEFLMLVVEKGSDVMRMLGFKLVVDLFVAGCWKKAALEEGLCSFARVLPDLALDVPNLPKILNEEMIPACEPLVNAGLVSAETLKALPCPLFQ